MATDFEPYKLMLETVKVAGIAIAGVWAYYRFLRQRTFSPTLSAVIICKVYGTHTKQYLVEFIIPMKNIGKVLVAPRRISFELKGLKRDGQLPSSEGSFPLILPDFIWEKDNVIRPGIDYEYIEPGLTENRRMFFAISTGFRFIHAKMRIQLNDADTVIAERLIDLDNPDQNHDSTEVGSPLNERKSETLFDALEKRLE